MEDDRDRTQDPYANLEPGALPPPGYYADPLVPGAQRYWDGERWDETPAPGTGGAGPQVVYVERPGTNGMAIASMVLGIIWIYWIGSVLAVIFGHVALSQLSQAGNQQGGRGMAVAGLVLGYIGLGVLALVIILVAAAG